MIKAYLFLSVLLYIAEGQHSMACGPNSCLSCTCSSQGCPVTLIPGQYVAFQYNYSSVSLSFEVEGLAGPPADLVSIYYFTATEFAHYVAGQPYVTMGGPTQPMVGYCNLPYLNSEGRGCVLAFACANANRSCSIWYGVELRSSIQTCSPGCETGMVDNGVCDAACAVSNCDYDGQDCFIQRTSVPPPPPTRAPSPPGTPAGTPPPPPSPSCPISCTSSMRGDGSCDNQCNYAACDFDDGDCTDPCSPNPCMNFGVCTPDSSTTDQTDYKCACPTGWCGAHCSTQEQLNNNGLKSQSYCVNAYSDCQDLYPDESVYFCCEWLLTNVDSSCRIAENTASVLPLSAAMLLAFV